MKESDLYLPLKYFLESQGYEVKGEVQNCDVMAVRADEEPVIVELKLNINLSVILQAVDRLTLSSKVYIGVPTSCKLLHRKRKRIIKLLRMLGLGLVMINPKQEKSAVQVALDPSEYRPRQSKRGQKRLLGEFQRRVGDPNLGGMTKKRGIMTAYRQRALAIAQYLEKNGPTKAAHIAKALEDPKARDILYRDVYGWFERVTVGVYNITPKGQEEIQQW